MIYKEYKTFLKRTVHNIPQIINNNSFQVIPTIMLVSLPKIMILINFNTLITSQDRRYLRKLLITSKKKKSNSNNKNFNKLEIGWLKTNLIKIYG